jgi:uncharacterized membrane protein
VINAREGFSSANREVHAATAIRGTQLQDTGDLIRNLPSAFATAVMAPLSSPLDSGGVSNLRRFLILELLPYMAVLCGAAAGIVVALRNGDSACRRQTVFIALVIVIIYSLLGTVVLNGGTLYRMRQPYVLLQIIFAVEGWRIILSRRRVGNAAR